MFISLLDLFKIGVGPSSSHTMGPMQAALAFRQSVEAMAEQLSKSKPLSVTCTLMGSLAFTGKGHKTDIGVLLGLHGYDAVHLSQSSVHDVSQTLQLQQTLQNLPIEVIFDFHKDIIFDFKTPSKLHPNSLTFQLYQDFHDPLNKQLVMEQTYLSLGGGFICTLAEFEKGAQTQTADANTACPYPFASAKAMIEMAEQANLSIAEIKQQNELQYRSQSDLNTSIQSIWQTMTDCIERGLGASGELPGELHVQRRAQALYQQLQHDPQQASLHDWLCAYAMAVNEENAAGHTVVTAPTNGAAGVIPAVLYYFVQHENGTSEQIQTFLLTAGAIGGLIKHKASISGAEMGCQGEVGSAAAMAAAGLCAVRGGSAKQIENAAEIALEHHLGMTCDPVKGLVQVPCIERNGFGAIKAYAAASLALRGSGLHFVSLDNCIQAMKETGDAMSDKFKETAQGGLAVNITEC